MWHVIDQSIKHMLMKMVKKKRKNLIVLANFHVSFFTFLFAILSIAL